MEHEANTQSWLVENGNGQVGCVPVAHLMITIDETLQKGLDGAAVIDGINMN